MKKIVLILCMLVLLSGCVFLNKRKSEFTKEELENYVTETYAIGDYSYVFDYYGDSNQNDTHVEKSNYHYYNYKESNERGLDFSVVDIRRYDVKLSNEYYVTKTDFDQKALLNYVDIYSLPNEFYLSNSDGLYSSSMSECFGKPYKIVVPYSDDFDLKLDSIIKYVSDFNNYNKELTGTENDLYVYLLFIDDANNKLDVRIFNKDNAANSECSYKNAKKCITNIKVKNMS